MTSIWLLMEHQQAHDRDWVLGVFSTPELAVRHLRRLSNLWGQQIKTVDFVRETEDLWQLGDPYDSTTYTIRRWTLDRAPMVERGGDEGPTAASEV